MPVTTTTTRPMENTERRAYASSITPAMFGRRLSWASIIAGVCAATFMQLLLGSLGGAIGANVVASANGAVKEAGAGLGIWLIVSTIVSMFIGGWVAGRLSGVPRRTEGTLHGFLTSAFGAIFVMFLMASAVGGIFGKAANLAGAGLQAAGSNPNVTAQLPQSVDNAQAQLGNVDLNQLNPQTNPQAAQVADKAAAGTAIAGYGLFAWLLIGCLASMAGGFASAPKVQRYEVHATPAL